MSSWVLCGPHAATAQAAPATGDQHLTHVLRETGQEIPFRLYVPKNYDAAVPHALVVALHGGGSDEDRVFDRTDIKSLAEARQVIVVAPRGYDKFGGYGDFLPIVTTTRAAAQAALAITPASVGEATALRTPQSHSADSANVAPTAPIPTQHKPTMEGLAPAAPDDYVEMPSSKIIDARVVDLSERDVMEVIEWVEAHYHVDAGRIYLTGNSMGGIGTEYLAVKYPHLWAAVAPAGCPTPVWSYPFERLRDAKVAVMFVHGERDNLSNPRWSQQLAEAATAHGVEARFLLIPGATHVSGWPQALPQIFDFLLAHRRGEIEPTPR